MNLGPAAALSQAAGLVVTASHDRTLRVWRLTEGATTLTGHTSYVSYAVVDVGGGRVASGGSDLVLRVWDVLSGKQLQQMPTGEGTISCAAALSRLGTTGVRSSCGACATAGEQPAGCEAIRTVSGRWWWWAAAQRNGCWL